MSKKIFLSIAVIFIVLLSMLTFPGCSDNVNSTAESDFAYDLILQLPRTYVGETDGIIYESLESYKTSFSQTQTKMALASVECIDTVFYVTIQHYGEDRVITGKSVAKCRVTSVHEKFNNSELDNGSIVELKQSCYILPKNEEDFIRMFESFGAVYRRDSGGDIIDMEINDGDYLLEYQENVEYKLIMHHDVLPMEAGQGYTGAIVSYESGNTIQYLAPTKNTQRYEVFQMSQSQINLATEIKEVFAN